MGQLTLLSKVDLLAIADFGLMELDIDKYRNLFEVIDGRDGRRISLLLIWQKARRLKRNVHSTRTECSFHFSEICKTHPTIIQYNTKYYVTK